MPGGFREWVIRFGEGGYAALPHDTHGDGYPALRQKIPLLIVASLNGGWTGDPAQVRAGADWSCAR
jgi:hypothetical protein